MQIEGKFLIELDERLLPVAETHKGLVRRSQTLLERLKEDIVSIQIKAGERLYERNVAERYKTSRTPAREALMRLLEDGLVHRQGRAYVVESLSMDLIEQLYDARECLETRAIAGVVAHMNRNNMATLQSSVAEMHATVASSDVYAFNRIDSQFHLHLARMSGNRFLYAQIASLHDRVRMIRNGYFLSKERQLSAHAEHIRILAALERGDVGVAQAEMRSHILRAIDLLRMRQGESAPDVAGSGDAPALLLPLQTGALKKRPN